MPLEDVKGFGMQYISNKGPEQSSVQPTSNDVNTHPLLKNSSASKFPPAYPKNLYMNMDSFTHHANQLKHLHDQIADQDSSTQPTGQSHQEVSGSSDGNIQEQFISAQSGNGTAYEKHVECPMKSVLSLGTTKVAFPPPKPDYNQSLACLPYTYADPYYNRVLTAYGSHAIPYLHESRHVHAMKRARGEGGRFLNTKKLQAQAQAAVNGGSTGTPSGVTSVSNGGGGMFLHQDHLFLAATDNFQSRVMENRQGGGLHYRVPVMR